MSKLRFGVNFWGKVYARLVYIVLIVMQDQTGEILPGNTGQAAKRNMPFKIRQLLFVLLPMLLLALTPFAASANANKELQHDEYNIALRQAFHALAGQGANRQYKTDSVIRLKQQVQRAARAEDHTSAMLQIEVNRALLKDNIWEPVAAGLFSYLLDQQAFSLAEELFSWAIEEGDVDAISRMNYYLAHYHYQLGNWGKAAQHLTSIDNKNALSSEQGDYATIIFGVTLQNKKQHRNAIKFYDEIKPQSPYYGYAQLNKAVAFVRQGWWTDAKIAIDSALKNDNKQLSEEFVNRLHLVLGYSQLQHEFYRNSRESFRHITVDSQYADRALLGIGLCALNQDDYAGALNAFNILKNQNKDHISVSEAYLLFAFTHEQMHQTELASAYYEEAIAYYNGKIRLIDQSLKALKNTSTGLREEINKRLQKHSMSLPSHLQLRIRNLDYLFEKLGSGKAKNAVASANRLLQQQSKDHVIQVLASDREKLVSYLSQAQFGQTKLFDTQQ